MTKVAILPVPTEQGALSYHAVAGAKHAEGNTAGQALDAITAQLSEAETSTLLIVQLRPDRFFTAAQQERLADLMARWRTARDEGHTLPCHKGKAAGGVGSCIIPWSSFRVLSWR